MTILGPGIVQSPFFDGFTFKRKWNLSLQNILAARPPRTHRVSRLVVVDDVADAGGPDEGVGGGAGRAVGRVGQAVKDDDVAPHEVPVAAVLPAAAHLKKKQDVAGM